MKKLLFFTLLVLMTLSISELKAPHKRNPEKTRPVKRRALREIKSVVGATAHLSPATDQKTTKEAEFVSPTVTSSQSTTHVTNNPGNQSAKTTKSQRDIKQRNESASAPKYDFFYEEIPQNGYKLLNQRTGSSITFTVSPDLQCLTSVKFGNTHKSAELLKLLSALNVTHFNANKWKKEGLKNPIKFKLNVNH